MRIIILFTFYFGLCLLARQAARSVVQHHEIGKHSPSELRPHTQLADMVGCRSEVQYQQCELVIGDVIH